MIKRILSYMRPYRKYAVLAVLCIAVEAMFELIIPLFMSQPGGHRRGHRK